MFESPPSPPRPTPPTNVDIHQFRGVASEVCCVYYGALASPIVWLGRCPRHLHISCHAALPVRTRADLGCQACRATVIVNEVDKMTLRQKKSGDTVKVPTVERQATPAERGGGAPTKTTTDKRRQRVICRICHDAMMATACVQMFRPCDLHRCCALVFD